MRLGIDYRLLASRENLVNRGIGRYTQQQLRHVLELDGDNEYLLLCPPGSDTSLVLPQILAAPNVSVCVGPDRSQPPPADPYDRRGLLRRAAEYQDWIHGLGIDVYHSTAPFVLEQVAPPAFDACPTVATVYDLIPLIFPSEYFTDEARQRAYAGAARMVSTATRLIAISEGTRDDVEKYLGVPRDAIDCAWPCADERFRPIDDEEVAAILGPLEDRVGLPGRFLLTVAALHHSKNLELLLHAYARLSSSFRRLLPLVVACHLNEGSVAHVRQWVASLGVADDVVLTGYVSDDELAALYNRAVLVVHPSRYEGFGLPVVEAMQCGAAVVTTTGPSLPEITAGAAVLVDPDDPAALAAAIEGLWSDPARRERLGELGVARAAVFTPRALAEHTLVSYRKALGQQPRGAGRPRMAVRTPVPPTAGEAAAHAFDLLTALSGDWDIDVFTDDVDGPVPDEVVDRWPVHHLTAFGRCDRCRPFDVVVHHGSTTDAGERSVVIVHSEAERARVQERHPTARVIVAPLATRDPCAGRPALAPLVARARLGWPADRFVSLVVGDGVAADGPTDIEDDDLLLACDVVVDRGSTAPRRVLVRAAAAGKPLVDTVDVAGRREEVARLAKAARARFEKEWTLVAAAESYRKALGVPPRDQAQWPAGLNKLCEAEDVENAALHTLLRDIGCDVGNGPAADTLGWAIAMAVGALREAPVGPRSRVLSLGAPGSPAAFHLTNHVGEVTVAGPWLDGSGTVLSRALLVNPSLAATGPFDADRLVVRHVDVCRLPFRDSEFDAVMACRAVPDDGFLASVREVARVVKPGGIVAMSTAVRLHGSRGGHTLDWILDEVVPASGLSPVDPVRTDVSTATRSGRRLFSRAFAPGAPATTAPGDPPLRVAEGALWGCLHLTLRKPGGQSED